jgi:hypothetical protein
MRMLVDAQFTTKLSLRCEGRVPLLVREERRTPSTVWWLSGEGGSFNRGVSLSGAEGFPGGPGRCPKLIRRPDGWGVVAGSTGGSLSMEGGVGALGGVLSGVLAPSFLWFLVGV